MYWHIKLKFEGVAKRFEFSMLQGMMFWPIHKTCTSFHCAIGILDIQTNVIFTRFRFFLVVGTLFLVT